MQRKGVAVGAEVFIRMQASVTVASAHDGVNIAAFYKDLIRDYRQYTLNDLHPTYDDLMNGLQSFTSALKLDYVAGCYGCENP